MHPDTDPEPFRHDPRAEYLGNCRACDADQREQEDAPATCKVSKGDTMRIARLSPLLARRLRQDGATVTLFS